MASFSYVAVDEKGKEHKGTIESTSTETATSDLKNRGLMVASIEDANLLNKDMSFAFLEKKPKPRDMSVFCRQFVSIIDAGVTVVAALSMLSEQTENKLLRAAIVSCHDDIERGDSLAIAMRRHPSVFPALFITMVEAGETSGSLDTSFTRMAEQFEKESKLKATVKKASIYPIMVCLVAVGVVIAMLAFVIPTFESMFEDLGTELPGITKMVIAASQFIQHSWYYLIVIGIGIVAAIKLFGRTNTGRHVYGLLGRKLPLIGNLTVKSACARLARTLSTLLASGIPLIEALGITANTMANIWFYEALQDAKEAVAIGGSLSEPLQKCGIFPPLLYHMIRIGEESGDIDGMLSKVAAYYEEEVESATQQLMAALEPLIIVLLAGIVGTIVLSIITPMASMYSALDTM